MKGRGSKISSAELKGLLGDWSDKFATNAPRATKVSAQDNLRQQAPQPAKPRLTPAAPSITVATRSPNKRLAVALNEEVTAPVKVDDAKLEHAASALLELGQAPVDSLKVSNTIADFDDLDLGINLDELDKSPVKAKRPRESLANNSLFATPYDITEIISAIQDAIKLDVADKEESVLYSYALHSAVRANNLPFVRHLLSQSNVFVNDGDELCYTPLFIAVLNNSPEMVKVLLEAGAEPSLLPPGVTTHFPSPFQLASQSKERAEIFQMMVDHAQSQLNRALGL